MSEVARKDALLGAAIQTVERLEALIVMINVSGNAGSATRTQTPVSTQLREIAALLDSLPLLQNDLATIKKHFRKLLSTDPDKTPRGMRVQDLQSSPGAETSFAPVEEKTRQFRQPTRPGLGKKE